MGRGGHHVSHHHHYHHRSGYSSSSDGPTWLYLIVLLVVLALLISQTNATTNAIKGKEKISDDIVLTEYLYDNADYFDNSREEDVVEGLTYFYEKTGVQMVVVTQTERTTDSLTEKMYGEMFEDETHVLIVLPVTKGFFGGNSVQYYWIGTNALKVVDERGMNRLFENIDNSWSNKENTWKSKVISLADLIVSK